MSVAVVSFWLQSPLFLILLKNIMTVRFDKPFGFLFSFPLYLHIAISCE